MIHIDNNYA